MESTTEEDSEAKLSKWSIVQIPQERINRPIVFFILLVSMSIPTLVTVLLTSDMTPLGRSFYGILATGYNVPAELSHIPLYNLALGAGIIMAFFAYLFDFHLWQGGWKNAAHIWFALCGVMFFLGIQFYATQWPSIPIITGMIMTLLSIVFVRAYVLEKADVRTFSFCASIVSFLLAIVVGGVWFTWAFTPWIGGYNGFDTEVRAEFQERGFQLLTGFIIWSSPFIVAVVLFLIGLFTFLRSRFHVEDSIEGKETNSERNEDSYIGGELKVVLIFVCLALLGAWVAASIAATDIGLSNTVERFSLALFVTLLVYIALSIPRKDLEFAAQHNDTVLFLKSVAESDWMKGIALLLGWPFFPLFFVMEVVHQFVRRCLQKVGIEESEKNDGDQPDQPKDLLTTEGRAALENMKGWNWDSVLMKCMYAGLIYFTLQVGISQGLNLFLSWLNEKIAPLHLGWILFIVLCIGLLLFLLPPIPGLPIYMVAGVVVVQRCQQDGMGFWTGVVIAVALCFSIKMLAIAMQQKCIGAVFSDNIEVRKTVGVQTVAMRAIEKILTQKGMNVQKVAVLIGGPDWPTSVLTGILKLRLSDMLLGSTPCFFLILPIVLATAFMLRAGQDVERAHQWQCMANVFTMLGVLVQMGSMIIAGYYIQDVSTRYKEELSKERPEDAAVIAAVAKDEKDARDRLERTGWSKQPLWLHGVLVLGSILFSLMMDLLILPGFHPFMDFTITQRISELPGGNPLSIIRASGWICIGLMITGCGCIVLHEIWCWQQMRHAKSDDESAPLLEEGQKGQGAPAT